VKEEQAAGGFEPPNNGFANRRSINVTADKTKPCETPKEQLTPKSQKQPQKGKFLTVQGDFGKFIDAVRRKLCCLRVYLGNVR
jgi:hypothetical protein